MNNEEPFSDFGFSVYYELPVLVDKALSLKAGVMFRGQIRVCAVYRIGAIHGAISVRDADVPTPRSLGLVVGGEGPPRPADYLTYSGSWGLITAGLGWDIDTREYADGHNTLTVGDAAWVKHYPDTVAGLVAEGRSISLSVVVANGESKPGPDG